MFTTKSKRKRVNNENPQPSKVSGVILVSRGGGRGKMFTPKSKRKRVNNENPQPSKVSGVILGGGERRGDVHPKEQEEKGE